MPHMWDISQTSRSIVRDTVEAHGIHILGFLAMDFSGEI